MKNIRKKALFIIDNVFYKGAFLKEELSILQKSNIDNRDYKLISNITRGVVQNRTLLDYVIEQNSKIKFKKIHKTILIILEMGIYQMFFLDRIPEYSIIDESVKLANLFGNKGSAGFVNGMLRNIFRKKTDLEKDDFGLKELKSTNIKKYLSIYYSHPEYYVDELLKEKSIEFAENLLKANNKEAPFTIRTNSLQLTRDDLIKNLSSKGYDLRKTELSKFGIIIDNPDGVFELEEFKKGKFYIQDEASMLVAEILNPKINSKILDLCSAPGGKTAALSMLLESTGEIISCDISDKKVSKIEENMQRLEIKNVTSMVNDATIYNSKFKEKFDYVLVDAPCSGLGLYRRKPEIKWNRSKDDILKLKEIQKKILENASKYIKKGGEIIYSTCTLTKEENEEVVFEFLNEHNNYTLEKIDEKEILKLYPSINNTDGFSIAKIKW